MNGESNSPGIAVMAMTKPAIVADPVSSMVNQGMVRNIIEPAMIEVIDASCVRTNCFN